jgi:hypothetical protein
MPTGATGLQIFPPGPILPSHGFAPRRLPRVARLIELRINRDRETSKILRSLARQPPPTVTNARPAPAAAHVFSRRLPSRAYRPFIGLILKGSNGSS